MARVNKSNRIQIEKQRQICEAADSGGRAVEGVDKRPFACWDCGFESRRGHEYLFLVNVVCS
jgi:hypothetical protein